MRIRKAEEKDIPMLLSLLSEILELHARIRPDIFIPGTTKYTESELKEILKDEDRPIFAAVTDDTDEMLGYAFCVIQKPSGSRNIIPFESVYIDDLCVTEKARGQGIGKKLFEYVSEYARSRGCYEVTLNVWEGNDSARTFYEHLGMKPKETQMEFIL